MPNVSLSCIRVAIQSAIIGLIMAAPATALAQKAGDAAGYPVKPIRVVVPFPPGGVADITPRVIGPKLVEV